MKKYKAIIFDVDGTLINPEEGVCRAVNYVIQKHGLLSISENDLKAFNGPPIHKSFKKHYNITDNEINALVESFRNRYKNEDLFFAYVYPGIYNLLDKLVEKGYKIGIATYKRQDYANKLMKHFSFDEYASAICGSDADNKLTKKDIIVNCLKELEIDDYSQSIMIGDSDNDAIAARNLGIDFLGVTYGFGFKDDKDAFEYDAIGCTDNPDEVYQIIEKIQEE